MSLSPEEDKRARELLAGVDLSGLNERGNESETVVPIKDIVFSATGINLLAGLGEDSFAILIGAAEGGTAIVSHIAEIEYRGDIADAFEEGRGMVKIQDDTVRVLGLYHIGVKSEHLARLLQPPFGLDFVMSGKVAGKDFYVDASTLNVQGQLIKIPSVRAFELPGN